MGKNKILFRLTMTFLVLSFSVYQIVGSSANIVFEDNFVTDIDSSWTWNPVDSNYSVSSGFLRMNVAANEATWVDSTSWESPHLNKSAPSGDWGIETFVKGHGGNMANYGLLIFQDYDKFLSFGYYYFTTEDVRILLAVEGVKDNIAAPLQSRMESDQTEWENGFYLRVSFTSSNNTLMYYYRKSTESSYTLFFQDNILGWSNIQVGIWGKSWDANPGFTAEFDYFKIYDTNNFSTSTPTTTTAATTTPPTTAPPTTTPPTTISSTTPATNTTSTSDQPTEIPQELLFLGVIVIIAFIFVAYRLRKRKK